MAAMMSVGCSDFYFSEAARKKGDGAEAIASSVQRRAPEAELDRIDFERHYVAYIHAQTDQIPFVLNIIEIDI